MKSKFLFIPILFLVSGCNNNIVKEVVFEDFTEEQIIDINFNLDHRKNVEKLKIFVQGEIDDTVKLDNRILIPAIVDTMFTRDWYASGYLLKFDPFKAKNGKVTVRLEFVAF